MQGWEYGFNYLWGPVSNLFVSVVWPSVLLDLVKHHFMLLERNKNGFVNDHCPAVTLSITHFISFP